MDRTDAPVCRSIPSTRRRRRQHDDHGMTASVRVLLQDRQAHDRAPPVEASRVPRARAQVQGSAAQGELCAYVDRNGLELRGAGAAWCSARVVGLEGDDGAVDRVADGLFSRGGGGDPAVRLLLVLSSGKSCLDSIPGRCSHGTAVRRGQPRAGSADRSDILRRTSGLRVVPCGVMSSLTLPPIKTTSTAY